MESEEKEDDGVWWRETWEEVEEVEKCECEWVCEECVYVRSGSV